LLEDRRKAAAESRFLADASKTLAESLDYDDTLARLLRLPVPFLADWCVLDVLEDDHVRRHAGAHVDPAQQALVRRLEAASLEVCGKSWPPASAMTDGRTHVLTEISNDDIRAATRDPAHATLVRALHPRSAISVPLLAHGRTLGALTLVCSRTHLRYEGDTLAVAEELGRRAAVALENARLYREAQASIRARDEFLSAASHELRTPVTSLLLMVQGIQRGSVPLTPERLLDRVAFLERQATHLSRLVDEMLIVGRINLGRLALELDDVDLTATTRDVVGRLTAVAQEAGCAVDLRAPGPVVGRWDSDKLTRVVTNLLANALKFGPGKPIEISVDESDGRARLTVTDHGIGITPEALPRVFDKFTRAVSARSYGGLGLGLHIVRRLVEAHGGAVTVASEPGQFTTFTVDLPLGGPEASA
jgi:signal transduction histidine kinase